MLKKILKWLEPTPDIGSARPPIQTGDSIDIVAVRDDGGVDLIIVVHGFLDDSEQTQNLLERKVKNYLQQRNSAAFTAEFRYPPAGQVQIVLETDGKLPHAIRSLVERLEPVVQAGHARLVIHGHKHRKHGLRNLCFPVLQRSPDRGPTEADAPSCLPPQHY